MKTTLTRATVTALIILFANELQPCVAATFSVTSSADAFVTTGPTGNLSDNNYGAAGALSIAAPGLGQGEFQSVLQFGLAGVRSSFDALYGAGSWTIQSVTLQLGAAAPNHPIFNVSSPGQFAISWMQNDSWTEGAGSPMSSSLTGISFSTLGGFLSPADEALGTFGFNGATSGSATYTLGLTPNFSGEVVAGSTISLRMFAADSVVSYLFNSRNFGSAAARPLLTITAVPEPGISGLAVLGFGLFVRRVFAKHNQPG